MLQSIHPLAQMSAILHHYLDVASMRNKVYMCNAHSTTHTTGEGREYPGAQSSDEMVLPLLAAFALTDPRDKWQPICASTSDVGAREIIIPSYTLFKLVSKNAQVEYRICQTKINISQLRTSPKALLLLHHPDTKPQLCSILLVEPSLPLISISP